MANLRSKECSDRKFYEIENLRHPQIILGGSGQIWVLRSFRGQKRSKMQITLIWWFFLGLFDKVLWNFASLCQSFVIPRRRSSNLVCSCFEAPRHPNPFEHFSAGSRVKFLNFFVTGVRRKMQRLNYLPFFFLKWPICDCFQMPIKYLLFLSVAASKVGFVGSLRYECGKSFLSSH